MAGGAGRAGVGRYVELWRQPYIAQLLLWGILARLSLGMTPLAFLLFVRAEGSSYAAAGGVAAAYSVFVGIGAPIAGRHVDRSGRRNALLPRAIAFPAALAVAAALGEAGASPWVLAIVAAAAGFTLPPIGSAIRTLLPQLAQGELRSTAFALEASVQEIYFVLGPLFVALLVTIRPFAALLGAAATCLVGTIALTRLAPMRQPAHGEHATRTWLGALRAPGVRTLIVLAAFMGLAFGPLEVAMPGFAELHHDSRALAGLALASFSGGSLFGGLLIGLRHGVDDRTRLRVFAAMLPLGLALPLLATSIPLLCLLVFLAGMPIAPLITGAYGLVDRVAPPGTHAETFSWIGTAITAGIASGTAFGGWLVDTHGVRISMVCGVAAAVLGAVFVALRRNSLESVPVSAYIPDLS